MIISSSHNFIFIHIHKCAGTSVAKLLESYCNWKDVCVGYNPHSENFYRQQWGLSKHIGAKEIIKIIGMKEWHQFFSFSFVRNPYARAVSLYTYFKQVYLNQGYRKYIPKRMLLNKAPFSYPVIDAVRKTNSFSDFLRHKGFLEDYGCQPQYDFLTDPDTGELLVDFVGTVENLTSDLQNIFTKLNLHYQMPEKLNSSQQKSLRYYYKNIQDIKYIQDLYKKDFESFGYTKDFEF